MRKEKIKEKECSAKMALERLLQTRDGILIILHLSLFLKSNLSSNIIDGLWKNGME